MKLTVDASIAVKWYVSEPHSEEARVLLGHRLERYAPDFVLVELANVFWKKARLGQLHDPQRYFQELPRLREAIDLLPGADLIDRAAQIAVQIDHPVYDCLYLACAEAAGSTLITADRRLANALAGCSLAIDVRHVGADGVAEEIAAAATALVITQDKLAALVAAHDLLDATEEHVHSKVTADDADLEDIGRHGLSRIMRSPAGMRLERLFLDLNDEERVDLLALGWLGRGNFGSDWRPILERACTRIDGYANANWEYVLAHGVYWRNGYERLTGTSL